MVVQYLLDARDPPATKIPLQRGKFVPNAGYLVHLATTHMQIAASL